MAMRVNKAVLVFAMYTVGTALSWTNSVHAEPAASGDEDLTRIARQPQSCTPIAPGDVTGLSLSIAAALAERELKTQSLAVPIKYAQWQQAVKAREEQNRSIEVVSIRYRYYERLLGIPESSIQIPVLDPLDSDALDRMKFSAREPMVAMRAIPLDGSAAQTYTFQRNLAAAEINQLFVQLRTAQITEHIAKREFEAQKERLNQATALARLVDCQVRSRSTEKK